MLLQLHRPMSSSRARMRVQQQRRVPRGSALRTDLHSAGLLLVVAATQQERLLPLLHERMEECMACCCSLERAWAHRSTGCADWTR